MPSVVANTSATIVIAAGGSTSGAIDLNGAALKRLILPATLQGAFLGFRHGLKADAMGESRDDAGVLIAVPFVAGTAIEFDPDLYRGCRFFSVRTLSDEAGAAQAQAAARQIGLVAL